MQRRDGSIRPLALALLWPYHLGLRTKLALQRAHSSEPAFNALGSSWYIGAWPSEAKLVPAVRLGACALVLGSPPLPVRGAPIASCPQLTHPHTPHTRICRPAAPHPTPARCPTPPSTHPPTHPSHAGAPCRAGSHAPIHPPTHLMQVHPAVLDVTCELPLLMAPPAYLCLPVWDTHGEMQGWD